MVCAFGGVAYGLYRPPLANAVTLILLPQTATSTSSAPSALTMSTERLIATSMPVLTEAGRDVSPPVDPRTLEHQVTVKTLTQQVVEIEVSANKSGEAQRLASAVASSYMKYLIVLAASASKNTIVGLQHESSVLKQQIESIQNQIDAASAAGHQDASLLNTLNAEQSQAALQLNNINNQIVAAGPSTGTPGGDSRVLQKATVVPVSKYHRSITYGIFGLLAGLLIGSIVTLIRWQRDRRLRKREEVASAIGAPVLASIESPGCISPSEWRWLLQSEPPSATSWALRRILHALPATLNGTDPSVRVISFAGDVDALTVGPQLALHAAASGIPTTLALGTGAALTPLRAALTSPEVRRAELPLTISNDTEHHRGGTRLVAVNAVEAARPELHLFEGVNLLSISPGSATTDEIARLALAAADAGGTFNGVIFVNPDPDDGTSGIAWPDSVHRGATRVVHQRGAEPRPIRSPG